MAEIEGTYRIMAKGQPGECLEVKGHAARDERQQPLFTCHCTRKANEPPPELWQRSEF